MVTKKFSQGEDKGVQDVGYDVLGIDTHFEHVQTTGAIMGRLSALGSLERPLRITGTYLQNITSFLCWRPGKSPELPGIR